jgi:hypothetical protein
MWLHIGDCFVLERASNYPVDSIRSFIYLIAVRSYGVVGENSPPLEKRFR